MVVEPGHPERAKRELETSRARAAESAEVVDSADKVLSEIRSLRGSDDQWAALVQVAFRGTGT
jgi:hypothetical protein